MKWNPSYRWWESNWWKAPTFNWQGLSVGLWSKCALWRCAVKTALRANHKQSHSLASENHNISVALLILTVSATFFNFKRVIQGIILFVCIYFNPFFYIVMLWYLVVHDILVSNVANNLNLCLLFMNFITEL